MAHDPCFVISDQASYANKKATREIRVALSIRIIANLIFQFALVHHIGDFESAIDLNVARHF